jgi:hypothetical protein
VNVWRSAPSCSSFEPIWGLHACDDQPGLDFLEIAPVVDRQIGGNRAGAAVLETLCRSAATRERLMLGAEASSGHDQVPPLGGAGV